MKRKFLTIPVLMLSLSVSDFAGATTIDVENLEAEALIAFHEGKLETALSRIDSALKLTPQSLKLLELRALTLKSSGDWEAAYKTYGELTALKAAGERRAAYEFEMGVIQFKQKNYPRAENHLRYSLREKFNLPITQYLLGSIFLEKKENTKAEAFLTAASRSEIKEFSAQSHLALGRMQFDKGLYSPAFAHLSAARELASTMVTNDAGSAVLGRQILDSTQGLVDSLEKSSFAGQVGLVSAYDSNVLLNPTSNADAASQRASFKETMVFSLNYATSPVRETQWQIGYQGAANYNFTEATRAGQFILNDLSVLWIDSPQPPLQYGFKGGGSYAMRYGAAGSSSEGKFAGYSATFTAGPFLRSEKERGRSMGAEVLFQPQLFFQDGDSPTEYKKTGWGGVARFYYQPDAAKQFAIFFDLRQPTGIEFQSKAAGLDFSATARLNRKLSLIPSGTASYTAYQVRSGGYRGDWYFSGQMTSLFAFTPQFNATATIQTAKNFSNVVDTYEYFRIVGSVGMNYVF